MGCGRSSSKRKVYSDAGLLQETRKVSNNLKKPERKNKQSPRLVEGRK